MYVAADNSLLTKVPLNSLFGSYAHALFHLLRLTERAQQGIGQRFRRFRLNEKSGDVVLDHLCESSHPGPQTNRAAGACFQRDQRQALIARRYSNQFGVAVQGPQILAGFSSDESNKLIDSQLISKSDQILQLWSVAD